MSYEFVNKKYVKEKIVEIKQEIINIINYTKTNNYNCLDTDEQDVIFEELESLSRYLKVLEKRYQYQPIELEQKYVKDKSLSF